MSEYRDATAALEAEVTLLEEELTGLVAERERLVDEEQALGGEIAELEAELAVAGASDGGSSLARVLDVMLYTPYAAGIGFVLVGGALLIVLAVLRLDVSAAWVVVPSYVTALYVGWRAARSLWKKGQGA